MAVLCFQAWAGFGTMALEGGLHMRLVGERSYSGNGLFLWVTWVAMGGR
jgi:hypothetical protein